MTQNLTIFITDNYFKPKPTLEDLQMNLYMPFKWDLLFSLDINIWNMLFRIFLSLVIGAFIGYFNERKGRSTGLRTHLIISLGANIIMILSTYISQAYNIGDPGRIAAQVVSGIGFLGAGAIIKSGFSVLGMTSAASVWTTAAIGLTIGSGLYELGGVSAVLLVIIINVISFIEKTLIRQKGKVTNLNLILKDIDVRSSYTVIKLILSNYDITIITLSFTINKDKGLVNLKLVLKEPERNYIFKAVEDLRKLDVISEIDFKNYK